MVARSAPASLRSAGLINNGIAPTVNRDDDAPAVPARRRMKPATLIKTHGPPKMNETVSVRCHRRLRPRGLLRDRRRPAIPAGDPICRWQSSETA